MPAEDPARAARERNRRATAGVTSVVVVIAAVLASQISSPFADGQTPQPGPGPQPRPDGTRLVVHLAGTDITKGPEVLVELVQDGSNSGVRISFPGSRGVEALDEVLPSSEVRRLFDIPAGWCENSVIGSAPIDMTLIYPFAGASIPPVRLFRVTESDGLLTVTADPDSGLVVSNVGGADALPPCDIVRPETLTTIQPTLVP